MAEVYFIVGKKSLNYEGVFDISELYLTIDQWFKEKDFVKNEIKSEENIQKEGKYIELILEPWKHVTDYIKLVIRVHIKMFNVTDVEVEIDEHKLSMNKGRVLIETESFLYTDYQDRWDTHSFYYFVRTLFDKFFFKTYTQKYSGLLKELTNDLRAHMKSFLNLHRFKIEK